jgi:carbonyl reductase 1
LIKDGGRLANVSSTAGRLSPFSPDLQKRFRSPKSVDDITNLMEEFTATVATGTHEKQGWGSAAYGTSKAGVTGMTKAIAEEQKAKDSKTLINSCCPGWVKVGLLLQLLRISGKILKNLLFNRPT